MIYALFDSIKADFDKAIREAEAKVGKGHWHGEPEGKRLCGRIDGLKEGLKIVISEYQKVETLEEDNQ